MAYRIEGLSPAQFAPCFGVDDTRLAGLGAMRMTADSDRGYPCRVSMQDARAGETVILVNHVSLDIPGPYRTAYAIYVREGAVQGGPWLGCLPPVMQTRALSLRAFGAGDLVRTARLTQIGETDRAIRELFADRAIAYIMAHYAAYGCFAGRIERAEDEG